MRKAFLLLFIIGFYSCNKDTNNITFYNKDSFSKIVNLKSQKLEGISQLTPSRFCVFDSILMVSDYSQNPRLHFYNKTNLKKIAEYGFIGEGPEEFKEPECNCQTFKDSVSGDTNIMIYEFGYGLIHKVNLSSILRGEKDNKIEKYYLNPEIYNADNLFYFDNIVIGEATDSKDVKYFKTPLNDTENFTSLGVINTDDILDKAESVMDRVNLDRSFMSYSKEKDKFVAAYLRYNKIKILDNNLNEEHTIYFGDKEIGPKTTNMFSRENIYYYQTLFAGKEGFYVPFIGVKNSESTLPQEIHFFDYSGKPLVKYVLDIAIDSFTFDEKDKKIYAITGSEETPFVVFQL